MKIFLVLVITALLCLPVISQKKTDTEIAKLNGSVKTVEVYRSDFYLKEGKLEQAKPLPWFSNTYNPKGNLAESITYNNLGNIIEKIVYRFDTKGRNTGYDEYHTIGNKLITVPRKHVYTLDDNGNRIEYRVFESNGNPAGRFTYKYDLKGNKIEDGYYYYTGVLGGTTVYTYDAKGNQTSQISYDSQRIINWKIISTYDSKGNRTEQLQYRGDNLKYKILSKYDNKKRILETETIEFNATTNIPPTHSPIPGKVIYTYNDEKRTKEVARYKPDGTLVESVTITFDSQENEIERVLFNRDESSTKYEFDSHGNWIKKTFLIQSANDVELKAYTAEERVITYY